MKLNKVGIGVGAGIAAAICVAGCLTTMTIDKMYSISKAVGVAGALVANECDISAKERNAVVDILEKVRFYTPNAGESFETAWRPIAQKYVDEKIAKGDMIPLEGEIIMSCFNIVVKSLDYIVEIKCPKAGEYKELTVAAISGFYDGFSPVFKPVNLALATPKNCTLEYDKDAYLWLKQNAR